MKQYEKVYSTDDMDYPDDPETTRMATLVVLFCLFAVPVLLIAIAAVFVYAEAIDAFMKSVVVFLYWHPFFTFTLVFYFTVAFGYIAMNKLLKP